MTRYAVIQPKSAIYFKSPALPHSLINSIDGLWYTESITTGIYMHLMCGSLIVVIIFLLSFVCDQFSDSFALPFLHSITAITLSVHVRTDTLIALIKFLWSCMDQDNLIDNIINEPSIVVPCYYFALVTITVLYGDYCEALISSSSTSLSPILMWVHLKPVLLLLRY